jgi:formate dehydrogenase subunit beta
MNTQWMLATNGDPLGTIQHFIDDVWQKTSLTGMLVPLNGNPQTVTSARLVEDRAQLADVNPFKPLMILNTARLLPETLNQHPGATVGAMLRPCEQRALVEMVKHNGFSTADLLTICVDCLGTFPIEDYEWRAERKISPSQLTEETLQFARQGHVSAYRYRSACQVCTAPQAQAADLNIAVLGLPVRQYILVTARDSETAAHLQLDQLTTAPADPQLVAQHERMLAKVVERNSRTFDRLISGLAGVLPRDLDDLVTQLESCESCQECIKTCPICLVDRPQRTPDGHYRSEDISRWLISCSGCGICENNCPRHLPLNAIFLHIRTQLADTYNYAPGVSHIEALPLM